ncbi:MAG: hypothetical protein M3072_00430 [Candidatus Dormibacteraeota bacterium]|nr:hypothetical protein [Candidatus Dormibacteraeota bacterium]
MNIVYRYIEPDSPKQAPLRMLFQPAGNGIFFKACEADSWQGLVAALLDDPDYERADAETCLINRLRLADDAVLLAKLGERNAQVGDEDGPETINVRSDERFIRSLDRLGIVSLPPERQ